jgi:ribose transport system permease protein
MTLVIIAGEIDLSVGSAVAFSGCVTAWIIQAMLARGYSSVAAVAVATVAAIVLCAVIGCVSGVLRMKFRVPTFIATLAWMTVLTGFAELITDGFPISIDPEWFAFVGRGRLMGVPFPVVVFLAAFVVFHFTMSYTSFGRSIYAVGGNSEAARLSGISVARVKIAVMAIVALLAALAGIMQAAQIGTGSATTGKGWELDVISAVIIGGTSLMGGAGTIWGTLVGVVFLGVLLNGMTLLDINEYWQHVVRGLLILGAAMLNETQTKRR